LNGNNGSATNTDDHAQPNPADAKRGFHKRTEDRRGLYLLNNPASGLSSPQSSKTSGGGGKRGAPALSGARVAPGPGQVLREKRKIESKLEHSRPEGAGGGGPSGPDPANVNRFAALANLLVEGEDAPPCIAGELPPAVPRVKEVEHHYCVVGPVSQRHKVYFDGDAYYRVVYSNTDHLLESGALVPDVTKNGPGWCVSHAGKGKRLAQVVEECMATHSLPTYTIRGVVVPECTMDVLTPLLNILHKSNPANSTSQTVFNAHASIVTKNIYSDVHVKMLAIQTIRYYQLWIAYLQATQTDASVMRTGGLEPEESSIDCLDPEMWNQLAYASVGKVRIVKHLESTLSMDWELAQCRTDVRVVATGGGATARLPADIVQPTMLHPDYPLDPSSELVYNPIQPCMAVVETPQSIRFPTNKVQGEAYEYGRFLGNGKQFQQYAVSGVDITQGSKRILGTTVGEWVRRHMSRQLALEMTQYTNPLLRSRAETFYKKHYRTQGCMEMEQRLFAQDPHDAHYWTNPLTHDDEDQTPIELLSADEAKALRSFTAHESRKVVHGCGRTFVQAWCDKGNNAVRWAYYAVHEQILTLGADFLSRRACAQIPAVKKALRQAYVNGILVEDTDNILCTSSAANVKRELAKPGKAPRLFVSYGAACMYANQLPEFVKVCLDGAHAIKCGKWWATVYLFAKPSSEQLVQSFRDLYGALSNTDYMYALIFSDDVVYAGNRGGTPFCFNGDISSNDSNQDAASFLATYMQLSRFHVKQADGLINQCTKPMRVVNPNNHKEFVTLAYGVPFEGSGTVLTTVLNHNGSFQITTNLLHLLANHPHRDLTECYKLAALYAGHVVTVDPCIDLAGGTISFEKVQFLKRSPVLGTDPQTGVVDWWPVKNAGCVLRGFGRTDGPIEPRHVNMTRNRFRLLPESTKMELFLSNVVAGDKNEPSCRFWDAMRLRFGAVPAPGGVELSKSSADVVLGDKHDLSAVVLDEGSFCRRYDLSESDMSELIHQIGEFRLGTFFKSQAATRFFEQDYGLDGSG